MMPPPFKSESAVLIATLGTEPQVVTAALDLLGRDGARIEEVVVLHTVAPGSPIGEAVRRLQEVFERDPLYQDLTPRLVPILDEDGEPLADVETPEAAHGAFRELYRQVRAAKLAGKRVHLSIAGGRKTMAVFGMVAAQLLFDDRDCLWHLYSGGAFLKSKRLHPQPDDDVHLIAIPVLLWGHISPVFTELSAVEDPFEAAERYRTLKLRERLEETRAFVLGALTEGERRVVAVLAQEGLGDHELGERLHLSPRTVEGHLRSAYAKAEAHWQLERVGRTQLIALLNWYYLYEMDGPVGPSHGGDLPPTAEERD